MDSWESIANMSNKDAAEILRHHVNSTAALLRGCNKTVLRVTYITAMLKAIQALEAMPDKEESNE